MSCTEIGKVCACSLMSAAAGKKATELPLCVAGKARSLLGGGEMNLFILSGLFQLAVTLMPGLVRSFLASTDIKRQLQGFAYLWYRPLIPLMDKTLKSEKSTSNFTSRCFYKRPIFFFFFNCQTIASFQCIRKSRHFKFLKFLARWRSGHH